MAASDNPHMARRPKTELVQLDEMAKRLRALRDTTGLSQERFAEKYGLGYKQWGNFETGSRIGLDAALTLVHEFRVTLDWIYLGDDSMMPTKLMREIDEQMHSAKDAQPA